MQKRNTLKATSAARVKNGLNRRKQSIQEQEELQIRTLAVFAVSAFILCWFPIATFSLLQALNVSDDINVEFSTMILAFLNSVVNPIIYLNHARKVKRETKLEIVNNRKQTILESLS